MVQYQKTVSISGGWVKASELRNGSKARIVSETTPIESSFKDEKTGANKVQNVAKVRFDDLPEAVNVALNRATINALVDKFGGESSDWQGHVLTVETEKMRIAGKASVALYLVPQGYKKIDDDNGYAAIVPESMAGQRVESIPVIQDEDVDGTAMPF